MQLVVVCVVIAEAVGAGQLGREAGEAGEGLVALGDAAGGAAEVVMVVVEERAVLAGADAAMGAIRDVALLRDGSF